MTAALPHGFERNHTVTDVWDGPIAGVADCRSTPHRYARVFDDALEDYAAAFDLYALDEHVFALELEQWAIWTRFEAALHAGAVSLTDHPALPEDRARSLEIEAAIAAATNPSPVARLGAEFRAVPGMEIDSFRRNLMVRWTDAVEAQR